MDFEISDRDLQGLEKRIRALPDAAAVKMYGVGCFAAAGVISDAARRTSAFTDRTGKLRSSIRPLRYGQRYQGEYVRDSAALAVATRFVGRFLEFGTADRHTLGRRGKPAGVDRGRVKGTRWLTEAARSSTDRAFNAAVREMSGAFPEVVRKVKRDVPHGGD